MTFMTTIYDSEIRGIGEDQMCQKADKKKGFKVGVYYQPLDSDTNTATTDHLFPWNIIWRSKAPLRVAFFVQTAALGNILTIDNLMKRKVKIIFWCYMCKCNGESVDHLMLHCPIISDLWSMIFSLFGVFWVMPKSVVELLACQQGQFGSHRNGHIWMIIPNCLMQCIWRERIAEVLKIPSILCLITSYSLSKLYWTRRLP